MFKQIIEVWNNVQMFNGIWETVVMVFVSTFLSFLIGLPIGILTVCTDKGGLFPCKVVNKILGFIINLGRAIPFIILLVALIPFTRLIIGTSIGVRGMIVPLTIGAIPFVARLTENTFREIDKGVIEASQCLGLNNFQIILKVYLVEGFPSLIRGISLTAIMLVGYSAMSGSVGGGGLGNIAIQYGYYLFDRTTMLIVVVVIILLVGIIQVIFEILARLIDKK